MTSTATATPLPALPAPSTDGSPEQEPPERDAPDAPDARDAPAAPERILLFTVAGTTYGCDMGAVREIVPVRGATRLPGAPRYVSGLINLRGSIVTVVDLALRLSGAATPADGSILLVQVGGRTMGLAVEDVQDVQEIAPDRFESAGRDLARGGIVRGVGHLTDGVVIVLDAEALVRQVMA